MMAGAGSAFSFDPLSRWDYYHRVNEALLAATPRPEPRAHDVVVDLGTSSGETLHGLVGAVAAGTRVVAIDVSHDELVAARSRPPNGRVRIHHVQALGETLDRLVAVPVSAAFFFNGIHLVEDKRRLVEAVARSLAPAATFSFNSTFFDQGEPAEEHAFYRRWLRLALRRLGDVARARSSAPRATARRRWSQAEYVDLLRSNGLAIVEAFQQTVTIPLESFLDLARYSLWIEGVLPGVPLAEGSAALVGSLSEMLASGEATTTRRTWLQVVAKRAA